MIMRNACRAAVVVVVGGFAAGCSETGFQDFFGAGKYAPDETQVTTNQPLAVPPDLQLRPPSDAPPQRVASRQPSESDQQQDLAVAPGTDEAPSPSEPQPYEAPQQAQPQQLQQQPEPSQQQAAVEETQQQAAVEETQQQAAVEEPQDPYERWGISRYHPDGSEKSQMELNAEMREKKLELERQKDPNYGTIWNLDSIWSDG